MFGVIKCLKGKRGWSCSKGRERRIPVLGWFIVSGDEGIRKSIVLRLDRATEIENSPMMGITWSITSSADGFAPLAPSVGLNLKTKRLIGDREFLRRKNTKDRKIHHPCSRARYALPWCEITARTRFMRSSTKTGFVSWSNRCGECTIMHSATTFDSSVGRRKRWTSASMASISAIPRG